MANDPEDPKLAELLDAYLSEVQAGRRPDREELLAKNPELAPALECVDALEGLAQPEAQPRHAADGREATTLALPDSTDPFVMPTASSPPAKQFGSYELLGELGRGGMGIVYKARHQDLNRIVALKMILASQLASGDQVTRFHAEAQAAAQLSHPHIVQVYEAGQLCGQHYFAMQYVDGASLADRLRRGAMPVEEAARCLIAVARAVAYLHAKGIVHRDLKPANILLDADGYPYVTDFGLAKMLETESHLTSSGVIVGTPSYMAPEQAAGRHATVGPRSDVYSLGAILYEMLTGRPPFREATPLDTLVQVLESEPNLPRQLNSDIPRELELICLKCMAKEAEQRYATAAELAHDLERFSRGEAIMARPQHLHQRFLRWVRQEPGLASHLGVLVLITAISQINYQLSHSSTLLLHEAVLSVLGLWALLSLGCQWLLRRDFRAETIRLVWLGIDGILLTVALWLVEAVYSPLLITYGLFIVASGLWFRARLVWFTTGMAAAGYGFLLVDAAARRALGPSPHYHIIFFVGLLALGFMVAYQVQRVRTLSRYYERRRFS